MSTPLDLNQQIIVSVYLKRDTHNNGMTLKQYADAVMDGTHPTLDREEFSNQFSPLQSTIDTLTAWAQNNNLMIVNAAPQNALVKIVGTAGQWNSIFNISLINPTENLTVFDYKGSITVPAEIANIVDHVLGLDNKQYLKPGVKAAASITNNSTPPYTASQTPAQVAEIYQFPQGTGAGACIGLLEFGGGYSEQNLYSTFVNELGLPVPDVIFYPVNGGTNNQGSSKTSLEVMLDIAVAGGIVNDAKIVVYMGGFSGQPGLQAVFDVWLAAYADTTNNPCVLSYSYVGSEIPYSQDQRNVWDAVLQQGLILGIPTFCCSGDDGQTQYTNNDPPTYGLSVDYPASSPYAIGVGGTTLYNGNETVWNNSDIGYATATGGGVSIEYTVPSWQTGLTFKTYNQGTVGAATTLTGRGVPDVAANGDPYTGYPVWWGYPNQYTITAGTSAGAPLWAALICLIYSITRTKIQNLNPVLYNNTSAFKDITVGNNQKFGTAPGIPGYSATTGWDACTGLGSPIGIAIMALYQKNTAPPNYPNNAVGNVPTAGQVWPRPNNFY